MPRRTNAPDALDALLAGNKRLAKRAKKREGLAELASLLLQLRHATGMTQAELARRSGVAKTLISELENAANDGVTLRTILRIARGARARVAIQFSLGRARRSAATARLCPTDGPGHPARV